MDHVMQYMCTANYAFYTGKHGKRPLIFLEAPSKL